MVRQQGGVGADVSEALNGDRRAGDAATGVPEGVLDDVHDAPTGRRLASFAALELEGLSGDNRGGVAV